MLECTSCFRGENVEILGFGFSSKIITWNSRGTLGQVLSWETWIRNMDMVLKQYFSRHDILLFFLDLGGYWFKQSPKIHSFPKIIFSFTKRFQIKSMLISTWLNIFSFSRSFKKNKTHTSIDFVFNLFEYISCMGNGIEMREWWGNWDWFSQLLTISRQSLQTTTFF